MYFQLFVGTPDRAAAWHDAVSAHAAFLELRVAVRDLPWDAPDRVARLALLTTATGDAPTPVFASPERVVFHLTPSPYDPVARGHVAPNDPSLALLDRVEHSLVRLAIEPRAPRVLLAAPPATPQQVFHAADPTSFILGDDLRFAVRWAGFEPDPAAFKALFQYGAIPPPMTPSRRVRRIPNGHLLAWEPRAAEPTLATIFRVPLASEETTVADPDALVEGLIDRLLEPIPDPSTLYYSGGIDSSLLAARLRAAGRTEPVLYNFSFDRDHPESRLALRMAEHLGVPCRQIYYAQEDVEAMLAAIPRDYSYPFGDYATILTNILAHRSADEVDGLRSAIDGTGADSNFGLGMEKFAIWRRIYQSPTFLRRLGAALYSGARLWRFDTKWERLVRGTRQSLQMPLRTASSISQNCLDGISYHVTPDEREAIEDAILHRVLAICPSDDVQDQFSALELLHLCAGECTAKMYDPLRRRGVLPVFPFLEPAMLNASFSMSWAVKCEGGVQKAILKRLLARHVPRELVYRKKSPFVAPLRRILAYPAVVAMFRDRILAEDNPIAALVDRPVVGAMLERASRGAVLSNAVYNFFWALMMGTAWFDGVQAAPTAAAARAPSSSTSAPLAPPA